MTDPTSPTAWLAYRDTTRAVSMIVAIISAIQGAFMLESGPARFSGPGFATAREIPGTYLTWGVLILTPSMVALWGMRSPRWHRRTVMTAFGVLSAWYGIFAACFWLTAFQNPSVSRIGALDGTALSLVCLMVFLTGMQIGQEATDAGHH